MAAYYREDNSRQSGDRYDQRAYPVGMTYTPMQVFRNVYDTKTAFSHGTIFAELDMPWRVNGGDFKWPEM